MVRNHKRLPSPTACCCCGKAALSVRNKEFMPLSTAAIFC